MPLPPIRKFLRYFLLLCNFGICFSVFSQRSDSSLILFKDQIVTLNPYLSVYHTCDTLSGQEAWKQIQKGALAQIEEQSNPGLEYATEVYWVTFTLTNHYTTQAEYYLEIDFPQIDIIQLFQVDSIAEELHHTGDAFPYDKRPVAYRNFVLPLTIPGDSTITYLLNLDKRMSTMRFPMYVYPSNLFASKHGKANILHSIFFSFLLLVLVFSVVLGIVLKRRVFLAYAFYISSFAVWIFTSLGYSYQLVIGDYPIFNKHLLPLCSQLTMMGLVLYVQAFFQTKKFLPLFHKVMDVALVVFVVGFCFWIVFPDGFVEYARILFPINFILTALVVFFAVFSAVFYRKIDPWRSRMFLLAYSIFFSSILIQIGFELGVIDRNKLGFNPILLGFLLEVIVLSFAMGIMLKKMLMGSQSLVQQNEMLTEAKSKLEKKAKTEESGFITLVSKAVLPITDIIYINSDDHYLEYHLHASTGKEIDRNNLTAVLDDLPDYFIQIHRSHIVNIHFVKAAYSDHVLLTDGKTLRLSRKYKSQLKNKLS